MTSFERHGTARRACRRWVLPLVFMAMMQGALLHAQKLRWLQADAPQGTGRVTTIHVTRDGRIFLSQGGAFVSNDSARSWSLINSGLKGGIDAFVDLPNRTVIAVGTTGIVSLARGATTWQVIRPRTIPLEELSSIALDSGGVLYAGSYGAGIYRSTDGGATWSTQNNGLGNLNIFSLCALPDRVFAATDLGLYSSDDKGETWTRRPVGTMSTPAMRGLIYDARIGLLAKVYQSTLFKSTDEGSSFEPLPRGASPFTVTRQGVIIGGNGTHIVWSDDGGMTWTSGAGAVQLATSIYSLAEAPDGAILGGGASYGLFRSTDMGTSWLPAYTDKMSTTVEELATDGRGLTVAKTPQGLMYTLNNGHRWDWFPSGPVPEGTRAIAVGLDRSIYVGTEDGLMRSIDSGNSWQPALQDSTMKPITSIITGRSGRILVAGGKGNIAIQSGGDWTLASSSIEDTITALAMDTKSNVIYCGTASGTLARSLDEGKTWDSREAGRRIVDIAIRATGELFLATDPPEIYTAASWEEPWTTLSNGLDGRAINVLIADTAGVLFIGTRGSGLFRLINHATTWRNVDGSGLFELPDLDVRSLATARGGRLFAGTGAHGIFWSWEATTGVEEGESTNAAIAASPNPCSAETHFRGTAQRRGTLIIRVYDPLGNLVATPLDGNAEAGPFDLTWSTERLASGVYYYTIEMNGALSTGRLIVAR